MAYSTKLPRRFPVGTKFVIEGHGKTYSRYLEFPDGTFFPLPARPVPAELKPKAPISRRKAKGGGAAGQSPRPVADARARRSSVRA
jgi:hypothetical protein